MYDESAQNGNMYGNGSALSADSSFNAAAKEKTPRSSATPINASVHASTASGPSAPSFSWQKNTNTNSSASASEATSTPILSPRLQVRGAVPSSAATTLSSNLETRRTAPSISPRLRYTSQSRRTAAPIQETSPEAKAALALEKPSLLSSTQLQAEATTLPYQSQASQHLNRLETPSHHAAEPTANTQLRPATQSLNAQPQPRTTATLGAPAQVQPATAPTLGSQTQTQRAAAPALGAHPYQPRTTATLGASAQAQRTTAPTLGAQTQTQRAAAPALGAQPYQPRTAATLGAPAQAQRTTAPTLGAQTQTQRATAPALGAQPYQPRTAATLGTQTQAQRTAAPTLEAQSQTQRATDPAVGTRVQLAKAPDPYQPGKAANYPATQPSHGAPATAAAAHTHAPSAPSNQNANAEAAAKPRRRPSVPNQPILKNGANNRGGAKAQGGRPVPTVSATPPKEFLKEKERKALLAQRVAEYNNIQSYYAGYMAYYEQQQNRLEQLIKDEKTSSIERKHLFEQQTDLYQKQRALFQLQTSLYEFVSSKNFDPSSSLPFTPLDEEAASGPKKFDKSPEEHWSAILGSEIKKQPKKQHKHENEKPYKITKKHESVLERRMRRMEELKRWEKEWKQYYKTDSFWRKQRYWGAFLFIVGVAIVVGILNISNVLKWFAADYEVPLLPIETHDLKTNYRHSYIPVHKGEMVPVDSRLISEKSPYNVIALRNGGNLRIDKYSDILIESLKTDKNERFLSGFFLRQGRVFAYSTPESMVFMLTPQVRVTPVNDQNTMYAVALKTDANGKQFTLLSVYRGMCVVGYTTGTLQTVRVNAGQSLKSYSTRLGVPEGLRLPDKWTKWNYNWDATDTYISPLASPKLNLEPEEEEEEETLEEEANSNAVEAFTKKQAADKQKAAKAKAKKKANKQKSKTKKMKN